MRLLLDTHIFLWFITGDERVRPNIRSAIENADAVYLSVASVWEATIKYALGKLPLPEAPHPWLAVQRAQHGIESLPIDEDSVAHLATLPPHHGDPFDRIIICQAIEHDLQIVSADPMVARYAAKLFPA